MEKEEIVSEEVEELRDKRTKSLIGVWNFLTDGNSGLDKSRLKLSIPLVNEIVAHYIVDVDVLKYRYKIPDKIQLHKVAGLMTALILRYRPVLPLMEEFESDKEMYANEILAVIHGLSICGEYNIQEVMKLLDVKAFQVWLDELCFLLHYRNYTSESLIFIYRTLSFFRIRTDMTEK